MQQLPRKRAEDSELSYLMIQYANVLLMIDFYIAKPVVIGIDLESLPIYRIAFQQYLIRELRESAVLRLEVMKKVKNMIW